MHYSAMLNAGFLAKLPPDSDRVRLGSCDILRSICFLIANWLVPPMLVFLTNKVTTGIVMVLSKIKCVYSSASSVYQGIAQGPSQCVIAPLNEYGVTGIRLHFDPEFHNGRTIFVLAPGNIDKDSLSSICYECFKVRLIHKRI